MSNHRVAATYAERLPSDVAGTVRGEKGHGLRDVFRGAKLAERIQSDDASFQLRCQSLAGCWRLGKTRTDAIDVNVIPPHLFGHGLGEGNDRGFGTGVDRLAH